MESRDYTGSFEEYLQEKADQYKLYPSDKVWHAINKRLHPRSKWPYLFVTALLIGLGFGSDVHQSSSLDRQAPALNTDNLADLDLAYAPIIRIDRQLIENNLPASSLERHAEQARVVPFNTPVNIASGEKNVPGMPNISSIPIETLSDDMEQADEIAPVENATQDLDENAASAPFSPMAGISRSARSEDLRNLSSPAKASSIKVLKRRGANLGWQLYFAPTLSYRNLSGEGIKFYQYNNLNTAYMTSDVENSVVHKPAVGFELGTALTYSLNRRLRLKAGIQMNVNRYEVQAYNFTPEVAPMTRGGVGHAAINAVSRYRNFSGYSQTWLQNQHIMMALPVGADLLVFGNEKLAFHVAATVQPTYIVNNQAYMISTNMKNYAQEPSLYNRYNMAAGAEAYLSIKSKSYRWMLGPQFRYQVFSSYKPEYPITEHLTDFGFKIGVSR